MSTLEEELYEAVNNNNVECVKELLRRGANVNILVHSGRTILGRAVQLGNVDVIEILLHAEDYLPPEDNYENEDIEDFTSLEYYLEPGFLSWTQDNNETNQENRDQGNSMSEDNSCWTENRLSLSDGWREPPQPSLGGLVLFQSLRKFTFHQRKCDVNLPDFYDRMPIHYAAEGGKVEVLEMLLKAGCRVNVSDSENITPLHLAVSRGHEEITVMLLTAGSRVNSKTSDKSSALHIAASRGYPGIVEKLLNFGAKIDILDASDRTPLFLAINRANHQVVRILLHCGAKVNVEEIHDGVVVIHDDYLKERKVFGQVVATFRYGREDDEVMGLHFYKELYLCVEQIYPPPTEKEIIPTKIQEKLIKKLGPNAYPFFFQLPINAPQSVILQPGPDERGQPCGVYYDVKLFAGQSVEDRSHKRSTVRLGIKKIQWAPINQSRQPSTIVRKDFLLSPGELELEVNLDRQVYFHGEQITVNVSIRNYSNKTIKRIRITAVQNIDICMFASGHCKEIIASVDTDKGCPILPGASIQKVVTLTPTTEFRRRGVALDGQLKSDDMNLASSTLLSEQDQRDAFGIIVSYYVKVKLYLGALGGEVSAELPFILMQRSPGKADIKIDSIDKDLEVAQFKGSRENTLDDEGSQGNPIFEDFGKTALIKS